MNALLSIILNKTILYNKYVSISVLLSLYVLVLLTFIDKEPNTLLKNLFLILSLCIAITICLYKLLKEKNYKFQKYSVNKDEYNYCFRKDKIKSYNEICNRLLKEDYNIIKNDFTASDKIDKFLLKIHQELNSNFKKYFTFERFDDYFINNQSNKTTGKLFYYQYMKSLVKIIKDFIINTNELENVSNEAISKFINELTNLSNLNFDSNNGLHYNDRFTFDFIKENTIFQKDLIIPNNEQLEIKKISIFNLFQILSSSIENIYKIRLDKVNKKELRKFVSLYFKSNDENVLKFDNDAKNIHFKNNDNAKRFILIFKYLTEKHYIENNESKISRILKLGLNESCFTKKVEDRTESIRHCFRNNTLSDNEKKIINSFLQKFLK